MLRVHCFRCKSELDEPGAILLSPVDLKSRSAKKHFCVRCYRISLATVERYGCCEIKTAAFILSPPDDDHVLVVRLCARHYQGALKMVDQSLRGSR